MMDLLYPTTFVIILSVLDLSTIDVSSSNLCAFSQMILLYPTMFCYHLECYGSSFPFYFSHLEGS